MTEMPAEWVEKAAKAASAAIYADAEGVDPDERCVVSHDAARAVLAAVLPEVRVDALVAQAQAQAWDACAVEAYERGWMHDYGLGDMRERNPHREAGERDG